MANTCSAALGPVINQLQEYGKCWGMSEESKALTALLSDIHYLQFSEELALIVADEIVQLVDLFHQPLLKDPLHFTAALHWL